MVSIAKNATIEPESRFRSKRQSPSRAIPMITPIAATASAGCGPEFPKAIGKWRSEQRDSESKRELPQALAVLARARLQPWNRERWELRGSNRWDQRRDRGSLLAYVTIRPPTSQRLRIPRNRRHARPGLNVNARYAADAISAMPIASRTFSGTFGKLGFSGTTPGSTTRNRSVRIPADPSRSRWRAAAASNDCLGHVQSLLPLLTARFAIRERGGASC